MGRWVWLRRHAPAALVLAAVCVWLGVVRDGAPSPRDDEVFLQAAYLMRTEGLDTIEAVTRAAGIQYGWGGELADRLRREGDIQTYALLPLWAAIDDFHVGPSPWGRDLYVTSPRLSWASQAAFWVTVWVAYWALLPLGRLVALVAAVALGLGHPFREGPALFDPWVMPLVAASLGAWLRDRHLAAALLAAAATVVKPNYVFLLPVGALAAWVRPGPEDPPARIGWRSALPYAAALVGIVALYLVLGVLDVIYVRGYFEGVRSGYDPAVLVYSLVETVSYTYRAGTQQLRTAWPVFPWTALHAAALVALAAAAVRGGRLRRTAAWLAAAVAVPVVANFTVIGSVAAYEDGGHFRWINVAVMAMPVALTLGYRELGRLLGCALGTGRALQRAATSPSGSRV